MRGWHVRPVDGSGTLTWEHEGRVSPTMVCSNDMIPAGSARLDGTQEAGSKRQREQHLLLIMAKALTACAAMTVTVMLFTTVRGQGGNENWDGTGVTNGKTKTFKGLKGAGGAALAPHSIRIRRSEGLHSLNDHESLAEALLSSPAMHRSRYLGIPEESTAAATASTVGGGDGSGSTESTITSEKRARVGYLIMASGVEELHKTKRLLQAIYDPDNFYLVHLDRKDNRAIRGDIENFIKDWDNVRMLVPSLDVSWGGYTVTLTAIFGICTLVQWSNEWDYFINLSASDFPLLPQSELTTVLGQYAGIGMNFVSGEPLNERNRVEVIIDDQGLYRETQSSKAGRPLKVGKPRLPPSKSMFTVYKGEFWVILHRSFCQYIEKSPDNVARSLQAYFSRFRISDESYFQTVLCHPLAPSFRVHPDNLRFVSWPQVSEGHYVLHPDPIMGGTNGNVNVAMESGALFARKFDYEVSQEAYTVLEESLSEPKPERLARTIDRVIPAAAVTGRQRFCAIPEGYNIQEVLSRPPKQAMGLREVTREPDVNTKNSDSGNNKMDANIDNSRDGAPSLRTRDAREGQAGSQQP